MRARSCIFLVKIVSKTKKYKENANNSLQKCDFIAALRQKTGATRRECHIVAKKNTKV